MRKEIDGAVAVGWKVVNAQYAVRTTINDYSFRQLPHPDYGDDDIGLKTEKVYEYLAGRYAA